MKKKIEKKAVKKPKVIKYKVAEENTPIVVDIDKTNSTATNTNFQGGDIVINQESTSAPHETNTVLPQGETISLSVPRGTFFYPIPETKEDYLALHKLLKDIGCNSIGDLEVRASKL